MSNFEARKEALNKCCRLGLSFKMSNEFGDYVGCRSVGQVEKDRWLSNISRSGEMDKRSVLFASEFLKSMEYIPFDEFYAGLIKSFADFLRELGGRKYSFLMDGRKYGSEHWLLQMIWSEFIVDSLHQPDVLYTTDDLSSLYIEDMRDVCILDDVIYSGYHMMTTISSLRPYPQVMRNCKFHIVVPFISSRGLKFLEEGISCVQFYPTRIIPSFVDCVREDVKLEDMGFIHDVLHPRVASDLKLNPHGVFLAVYLDFKIAKNTSTATFILEDLVQPKPSRRALQESEQIYLNFINQ